MYSFCQNCLFQESINSLINYEKTTVNGLKALTNTSPNKLTVVKVRKLFTN